MILPVIESVYLLCDTPVISGCHLWLTCEVYTCLLITHRCTCSTPRP